MAHAPLLPLLLLLILAGISKPALGRDVFLNPPPPGPFMLPMSSPNAYLPPTHLYATNRQNLPPPFSCTRKCGLQPHPDWPCQCHAACQEFEECCQDFEALCFTCSGRCKSPYAKNAPCQCNKKCTEYGNCCPDIEQKCPRGKVPGRWLPFLAADDSCVDRCGDAFDHTKPCQCNTHCEYHSDCCSDYVAVCTETPNSCYNKCEEGYDPSLPCQCNKECPQHGNCCEDFDEHCGDGELPGDVSDAELAAISEELLSLDNENNVASLLSANLQGRSNQDGVDKAPLPLLTIDPSAYSRPTIAKLIPLLDNYVAAVGVNEDDTPEERQEVTDFLDLVLATPIMQRTAGFLAEKGLIPLANFRETFHKIWFGLYSRGNNALGSSGFEHVFLGELKNGVSGFHHWAYWAKEEQSQDLNYKGYIEQHSLGAKGMVLSESFEWRNAEKPISSMFLGPSPEFELALYTICWYARPNAICNVVLNNTRLRIQTYDINYGNNKFIATAYPE